MFFLRTLVSVRMSSAESSKDNLGKGNTSTAGMIGLKGFTLKIGLARRALMQSFTYRLFDIIDLSSPQ